MGGQMPGRFEGGLSRGSIAGEAFMPGLLYAPAPIPCFAGDRRGPRKHRANGLGAIAAAPLAKAMRRAPPGIG